MKKPTIGVFGLGNMGGAIFERIPDTFSKLAYDPFKNNYPHPLEMDISNVISKSDILILCVKPDGIIPILEGIKIPKQIISIAAGISLSTLRMYSHPDSKILRIMPNLPLTHGEGVIACVGDKDLFSIASEIFQSCGKVIELKNEEEIDCITALSGSGPAFVFTFAQAMAEGGVLTGLNYSKSLEIAIQTIKGSVILLEKELKNDSESHPYKWRNKVTSAGGTTIAGLEKLEGGGFVHSVMNAIMQAFKRTKEIGRK